MKYAIEILNKELDKIDESNLDQNEDYLIDAIIYARKSADTKLALKILKEFVENSKTFAIMPK